MANYSIEKLFQYLRFNNNAYQVQLLEKALNAKSEIEYQTSLQGLTKEVIGYENVQIYDLPISNEGGLQRLSNETDRKTSYLGLPLWMSLELYHPDLKTILLENAIVEISQNRNIVTTSLQGRNGTVKEFISNGDYELSIKGLLFEKNWSLPKKQTQLLHRFFTISDNIEIIHEFCNSIGIYEIVITNFSFPYTPFINCVAFEFNALSDTPLTLKTLS